MTPRSLRLLGGVAVLAAAGAGAVVLARRERPRTARSELTGAPYPIPDLTRPPSGGGNTRVLGPEGEPRTLRRMAEWVPPRPQSPAARAAAYAWAAPVSLLGLVLGAATGVRPQTREGVLLFAEAKGVVGPILKRRGYTAMTLGHVVVARHDPSPSLLAHELVHTRQAERLGPFFTPVYLALYSAYGYTKNPMERAARLGGRTATSDVGA
jgi:hypothetical protein